MCGTENETAGAAARHPAQNQNPTSSPYSQVQDYISQVGRYKIIESILDSESVYLGHFANAFFTTEDKIKIATMLSDFGVDYLELTSPVSSEQSYQDCKTICNLGLKAKILTHVRCNMEDAKKAVECGVDGVDLVIGTSSFLREFSHGKSMELIQKTAIEVIEYVKSKGVEVRFSSEDSFRSDLVDILTLYKAVDKAGVNRVGVADTVGGATPRMVYDLVRTLRETHFHDDTGCAVANALTALEGGATHIDTSVLGIGEQPQSGALMARMVVTSPEYTKSKYNLPQLKAIEEYVAKKANLAVFKFNNPVTGFCAFTHKAGIHAKAILANPSTYEIIDPALFGCESPPPPLPNGPSLQQLTLPVTRYISITSRITGWNAVKSRVQQLGLDLTDDQIKEVTAKIKQMADIRPLAIDDTDSIIHSYHLNLQADSASQTKVVA
ncbi:Homocitrate synthase [Fusarium mundagurra]|uniref:Homocitrate synthase n=1 Tax=Fusarium mundagurra TaxID=1567541 RepID=A0A8H5YSS8_9HYPO|nr:Homocitrate synthase [Fusarium mundagurra]